MNIGKKIKLLKNWKKLKVCIKNQEIVHIINLLFPCSLLFRSKSDEVWALVGSSSILAEEARAVEIPVPLVSPVEQLVGSSGGSVNKGPGCLLVGSRRTN